MREELAAAAVAPSCRRGERAGKAAVAQNFLMQPAAQPASGGRREKEEEEEGGRYRVNFQEAGPIVCSHTEEYTRSIDRSRRSCLKHEGKVAS